MPQDQPPDPEDARIERIKTLTQNARTTWFGYLGALAFAGVTLLGIEDVDFFSAESQTQLPLLNVSVPVTAFFWAGAPLIALFYGYLHVFLDKLWVELGKADPWRNNLSLAQTIQPWLVSDAALLLRRMTRREDGSGPIRISPLGFLGALASFTLCWLGGPVVLYGFWYVSMPAHIVWLTGLMGALFAITLWTLGLSLMAVWRRMHGDGAGTPAHWALHAVAALLMVGLTIPISRLRTVHDPWAMPPPIARFPGESAEDVARREAREAERDRLQKRSGRTDLRTRLQNWFRPVPASLAQVNLTELPGDWSNYDTARREFFAEWCDRPDTPDCDRDLAGGYLRELAAVPLPDRIAEMEAFAREWSERRTTYLRALPKPILRNRDLRRSDLFAAHLPGIDLSGARLEEADLSLARLEGADLFEARLEGADLFEARLEGAFLSGARLEGAFLSGARLEGADLSGARLEGADLFGARLEGADLSGARLEGANLSGARLEGAELFGARLEGADLFEARLEGAELFGARLEGADLFEARLEGADLSGARLEGANLSGARLEGAELSYSLLTGTADAPNLLDSTNLSASTNDGGALRFVDMRQAIVGFDTDFRNSFGDGTVRLPDGLIRPCHWGREDEILDDSEFFGRWRGWLVARPRSPLFFFGWEFVGPEGYEDVPAIPPPPGCEWNTWPLGHGP